MNTQKVDRALVDLLADQVRQTTFAGCALITVVGAGMVFSFPQVQVLAWVLIGYLIAIPRYFVIDRFKKKLSPGGSRHSLEIIIAIALFTSALHWGAAGWLFLDTGNVQNFALVCGAILGVIASALAIYSTRPLICCLFTVTVFLIVMVKLLFLGNWVLAIMCLIVLPPYSLLSHMLGRRIALSITQDFRNAELLEQVRAARDEAELASREKSLFMTATSHDLRQPLHAQSLILQIMASRSKGTELEELVDKMTVSNDALITLFNSLLEVSQLDAGTIEVHASHHSLSEIAALIIEEFQEMAKQKGITIEFAGDDSVVYSDPILLMRILRNLISNALKFTSEGRVSIVLRTDDSRVHVSVCDTGIGIPESEQSTIFSEYTQLENPSRDRSKGIGLGLALVRRMCELLGHEIEVESTIGQGSCFYLTLPAGDINKVMALGEEPVTVVVQGLEILLIDDEQPILDAMTALFNDWHCSTRAVTSLTEAVREISNNGYQPDLIISDYRLGENTSGIEAIAHLRKLLSDDVPAILISGDTDPRLLERVKDEDYYMLHKPVDVAKLRKVIGTLLPSAG